MAYQLRALLRPVACFGISLAAIASLAASAEAQAVHGGRTRVRSQPRPMRFQPSRPTVSPYLNLFRNDVGPLPNYHLLVRPQLQQRAINEQFQRRADQQEQAVQQLGTQLNQMREGQAGPTGIGSSFGNYLQYYPGLQR